jgi:hypothetical protein
MTPTFGNLVWDAFAVVIKVMRRACDKISQTHAGGREAGNRN